MWENRTLTATNSNTGAEKLVLRDLEASAQYEVQIKARNRHGYYDDLNENGSNSFSMTTTVRTTEGGKTLSLKYCAHLLVCMLSL